MRIIHVNQAETSFHALLAAAEAGEEIALTRHGRVVARLLPGILQSVAAPRPRWGETRIALDAPPGIATEPITPLD